MPWSIKSPTTIMCLITLAVLLVVMAITPPTTAEAATTTTLQPHAPFVNPDGTPEMLSNVTFFRHDQQLPSSYGLSAHWRGDITIVNTYRCMHGLGPQHWLRIDGSLSSYANTDAGYHYNLGTNCHAYTWESTQTAAIKAATNLDVSLATSHRTLYNVASGQCETAPSPNMHGGWTHFFCGNYIHDITWDNPRSNAAQHNQALLFLWKDAHVWGRTYSGTIPAQYVGTVPDHGRRRPFDVLNAEDKWLEMIPQRDPTRNYTTCEAAVENFYNQHFGLDAQSGALTDGTVTQVFTTEQKLSHPWFVTNVTIDGENDPTRLDLIPGQVYNMTYISPTTRPTQAKYETIAFCSFGDISAHTHSETGSLGIPPWAPPTTSQCLYQNEDWSREMNGTYTNVDTQNNIPKGTLNTFVVNGVGFTQHWRSFRIPYDVVNSNLAQICIANVFSTPLPFGDSDNHQNTLQSGRGEYTNGIARLFKAPYARQCISALKFRAFEWRITAQGTCGKVNATQTCGPMVRYNATYECVDRRVDQVVADEQCELHADPQIVPPCDEYVDECSAVGGPCEDAQNVAQFDTCGECNRGYNGTLCDYQYQWHATPFEDIAEEDCVNIFTNQTCGQQQKMRDVECALIHHDTSVEEQIVDSIACLELVDLIGEAPEETKVCTTATAGTCENDGVCSTTTGQCECQHGYNGTLCDYYQYQWYATPFEDIPEEECVEVYTAQTCGNKQKVREVQCILIDPQQNNTILEQENVDIAECINAVDIIGAAPEPTQLCNTTMGLCGNGGVCTTGRCECAGGGKYSGLYCEQNNNAMHWGQQQQHIALVAIVALFLNIVFY